MKIAKFFALLCAATVGFVACTPTEEPQDAPNVSGNITLTADKTEIELGDEVNFSASMKNAETGEVTDVTAFVTLYDSNLDTVANPFKPEVSGIYNVMASYGAESSNIVTITVMGKLPDLPEDPDPSNLAFNHRVVLTDHTGVNCPYCPQMVDKLEQLAKTEYHNHYNEVTCHGNGGNLTAGDPANSQAAEYLGQFHSGIFGGFGMPTVIVNFYSAMVQNSAAAVNNMKSAIDSAIKKDGADAGISVAVAGDPTYIYCSAQVKAKVAQEYKAVAWLLESNIYSPGQAGATKAEHKVYNYALRNISGEYSKNNVSGESIGVLAQGETKNLAYALPITSTKWKWENMGVLVIVSAKNATGHWEVVNSAYCDLNDYKTYEYVE